MTAQRELPPRRAVARTAAATQPARLAAPSTKPDARPMRVVYGAGAVAALSVMAVGLVQPDFAATADQPPAAGPGAADQPAPDIQVRHVVRYIQLQPGQKAPRGATVIAARGAAQPATRTPTNNVAQSRPAARPAAQPAAPQPQPKPRVNTRQSGKPR